MQAKHKFTMRQQFTDEGKSRGWDIWWDGDVYVQSYWTKAQCIQAIKQMVADGYTP